MNFKKSALSTLCLLTIGCISTKSTLKNVDYTAPNPVLNKNNTFVLSAISTDTKYGYHKDYPINVYFQTTSWDEVNQKRFLDALAGPNGEKISYKRTKICCPFPTKNINTGGAFLDIYEINYEGLKTPILLYINKYEKGLLMSPVGFTIKK